MRLEVDNLRQDAESHADTAGAHANAARGHADSAEDHASTAKDHASTAKGHAETAKGHAETAKGHAETTKGHAETTKGHAETTKGHAETTKGHAETTKGHAETTKGHAETAKGHTETAKGHAETAKGHAETAKGHAETAKGHAVTAATWGEKIEKFWKHIFLKSDGPGARSSDALSFMDSGGTTTKEPEEAGDTPPESVDDSARGSEPPGSESAGSGDHSTKSQRVPRTYRTERVKEIQQYLIDAGYPDVGKVDGHFGNATKSQFLLWSRNEARWSKDHGNCQSLDDNSTDDNLIECAEHLIPSTLPSLN